MNYLIIKHPYKKFHNSQNGITSVITTVAIIAIVMGFIIGPYFMYVIPERVKRNEAEHLREVENTYMALRGAINSELDQGRENMVLSTPLKLGTEDESFLVIGGSGRLEVNPSETQISINNYYDPLSVYARGSGNIKYTSKNIYQADRSYIYENDGIVILQKNIDNMKMQPGFDLTRRRVINTLGIDTSFGTLSASDQQLDNIYLINTVHNPVTVTKAILTWQGGNATTWSKLDIDGGTVEWTGTAASGVSVDLSTSHTITHAVKTVSITFDADIRDTTVTLKLITQDSREITGIWPATQFDTVAHAYDTNVPSENAKKFAFKNVCGRVTTIKNLALTWTGNATLWKVNIIGHGNDVWETAQPGIQSPVYLNLSKDSIFQPDEVEDVNLFFQGDISNEEFNVKFFTENSTNHAIAVYPVSLNQTFINGSFSIITLVTPEGDRIQTSGKSTKIIKTTLVSCERNIYQWEKGERIVINITTTHENAWFKYLNTSLVDVNGMVWDNDNIGAFPGDFYITKNKITDKLVNIKLILNSMSKLECTIGVIKVEIS